MKCIILSQGPVPTPEHTTVEGGGLRCWGLAKGILANNPDIEVTVAYHESYVKDTFTDSYEGIRIATWDYDNVANLIGGHDSVVVSYCMGQLSVNVVDAIRPDQQLVLDCNVPIYVEVSARDSSNVTEEYRAFEADVHKWDYVLKRGDLFLCASEAQKEFYTGVLSAVGRINPVTYSDVLILIVPYGIYRDVPKPGGKPISKLIGKKGDYLKILWFGGIYPWFDIRNLADAVKEINKTVPAKLIVVGAKNPFNQHPDFLARYDEFIKHVSTKEMKQYVIVQDWINFNDRADWYLDADVVVVFNKEGEENKLAWRTRLVDFMWADLPVLTNGGDPLGETMISNQAAVRLNSLEPKAIAQDITGVLGKGNTTKITELTKNMRKLKADYYWDNITKDLAAAIQNGKRADDLTKMGVFSAAPTEGGGGSRLRVGKVISKAKKVPAYANKYGYRTTGKVINEIVRRKLMASGGVGQRTKPAYVFVSHQLDMSGGPFIAIDMALDFKAAGRPVEFYTYLPAHHDNLAKLNAAGIKPHVLMNKDMVPSFIEGDTVILNTVAHSEVVKEALFRAAERGFIKQLLWYLHEDDPQLLFRPDEQKRIRKMLKANQVKMLIAAHKMRQNYIKYFDTDTNIILLPYRHVVPKKYHRTLDAKAFDKKLTFVLPGTIGDGRKGQLPIFYAFHQFYEQYYKPNPAAYRDFELVFVGLSDDFLSRQILHHSRALAGHFTHHGKVTWEEDLQIVAKGNMTICYSLRECLPLFVFEGMISGHPILRNDSSGMEEQLLPGKNGFYLESDGFTQVVETIEAVLNKSKTSNKQLADMSKVSYGMAKKQEDNDYLAGLGLERL
jgi:glycosyltransferase involved in cell wall biosynthesis